MSKNIRSYGDLRLEREKLEALLAAQKELIQLDLQEIKTNLKPATNVLSFVGKFKDKTAANPLLGIAVSLSSDILMRKLLFKRAGWAVKTLLPFVLRKVTNNVVARPGKTNLVQRLVQKIS